MAGKDSFAGMRRAIGYGVAVTVALGSVLFLFNFVVDRVIDEVEVVIQPCQHGGVWVPTLEKCSCVGPWSGPYCSDCTCKNNGVCDQNNVNVPFTGTLWGCRCPDNWLGSLCDLCTTNRTDERCVGECLPGYSGSRCETTCVAGATFEGMLTNTLGQYDDAVDLWIAGGEVNACSGHGSCDYANDCDCDLPTWFPSADGRSQCARTCASDSTGQLCYGHGACTNIDNIVGCVCEDGWHLYSDCSVPCPGLDIWVQQSCSGKGVCGLEDGVPACECLDLHLGDACQYKCPTNEDGDSSVACNGHGVCSVDDSPPFPKAACACANGWVGESCQCNDAQTCSGHGSCMENGKCACDEFWEGQRCNACVRGRFGSQCTLQCNERKATDASTPVDDIGCNSRGVCAVSNFARANEKVVCGCAGNFDAETHCHDCKEFYYPKIGESGLSDADEDAEIACTAFANRASCNFAGEPKLGFSSPASSGPPCACDQPHADGDSFCTVCHETFYPDGGDMSDPSKCTKRCVDQPDQATWYPDVFTLVCKNQGVCDPTGDVCVCPDGYSGKDCGIACGGETPCSGHGSCVSNKLQQFMSAEVKNSVDGGTSHMCSCDPQPELDDNEKLKLFTGEEELGGDSVKNVIEYTGDFCEYSCLKPPWLDAITCNGETCALLPIVDNQGSPIITDCTQDSDCGDWNSDLGRVVFADENGDERTDLTPNELELRGQVSLQNRWSPRMGPLCHVPTVPSSIHVANMKCVQRVNSDSVDETTEANCEEQFTRVKCQAQGGTCRWADACKEALDDVDEYSYCYELLRTERPEALRSENCTSSCDVARLQELDWAQVCNHYTSRTPEQFATCGSDLDELCVSGADATAAAAACAGTLPLETDTLGASLSAQDAAAVCFESNGQTDAIDYPFGFEPLLDTTEARNLQAGFYPAFVDIGRKHACTLQNYPLNNVCSDLQAFDTLYMLFDTPAPPLYVCEVGGDETLGTTDLSGTNVFCKTYRTVRDLNPFRLDCGNSVEDLQGLSVLEALDEALSRGCSLVPKSNLHSFGVAVTEDEASAVCRKVLEDESPNNCKEVCGGDPCTSVGTNAQNVHIFECERPDPTTVSAESCLLGVFSLTGAEGGAVYRCAVPADDLLPSCGINYLKCQDTLALHVDQIGEDDPAEGTARVGGILGHQYIFREDDEWRVSMHGTSDVVRVEFDVRIVSEGRGTINVMSKDGGVIASILLHHFGGRGWNLNGQSAEEAQPCAAGLGDSCKTTVNVNEYYRVVLRITSTHVRADFGADASVLKERAEGVSQTLDSITVSGGARLKQVFAFSEVSGSTTACDYEQMCSNLYRKTGRAATWRESADDILTGDPVSTLAYCANREKSVSQYSNCQWGTQAEHDTAFSAPWHKLCAYHDYVAGLGDCTSQPSRDAVVGCAPVLSKFDSAGCARSATAFDWEQEYCEPLRQDTSPSLLSEIGCDSECLAEVERSDLRSFCDDRSLYWDGAEAVPRVPEGCVNDDAAKTRWRNEDWKQFCAEKASNTAKGVCSAATCDCSLNGGFLSGDSCELSCVIGSDGSACNEDSFSGVCDYRDSFTAQVDAYYAEESNLVINHRASEIQGECRCANSEGLAREGCDVTCDTDDGEELCNNRTYADYGGDWSISACHAGGTGVCACMPRLTRQIQKNISDWRGNKATVLSFEYGGMSYSSSWQDKFRLRSSQGARSLMINYFNYTQSTWKGARQKFELEPALFMCGDEPCDFSDVVLAQGLYGTSSFYGPTCSRRCPSVETGEALEPLAYDCVGKISKLIGADRLTLGACESECLDTWKCNYIRFDNKTSDCRMYEKCGDSGNNFQETNADVSWHERKLAGSPQLVPCSGRGRCTPQGACVCDSAKYLSLTDPITGLRMRTGANEVGSLQNIPVTSLDTTGFRGSDCSKVCPGFDPVESDMSKTCSGHGICTRAATCQCAVGYTGINCELPCPRLLNEEGEAKTTCSGHGTCFEARVNLVGASVEQEDVLQHYQLTEAWRRWYNLCGDNTPLKYLILPFGNYPGTLNQSQIRGGVGCDLVPQIVQDDVTKPFVQRPEIEMQAVRDFLILDEERDLDEETDFVVHGASGDATHNREGVFRRRYWQEDASASLGNWRPQTVFVENFAIVQIEDGTKYEQYQGFSCCDPDSTCNTMTIGTRETSVQTVGECAQRCENTPECACFDYQEFYHSAFFGGCRLARQGSLYAYPIHRALQVGAENGLVRKDSEGDLIPFDDFEGSYVVLQDSKSCRAPLTTISENCLNVAACAQLCADRFDEGCVYFTYSQMVLRCSQVKTASSECPEGFSTDPSGFFAVAMLDQGSTAPVAYDSVGSTRLFPPDKARGTLSGLYYGRARPDWVIAAAQCSCSKSYSFGWWAGFACQSCDTFWGGSACTRRCPGIIAGEPCWGNGDCLWGSVDGLGTPGTFFDAVCLCGSPAAPKKTDLSLSGTWTVTNYDLHQEAIFSRISINTPFFENPNNYGFADAQCRNCIEQRGGRNCAAKCSYCLYAGECQFTIADSVSVPCSCSSQYYDTLNGCSPRGFILDEIAINNAVGGLTSSNRAKRLQAQPGLEILVGQFYDQAVFPSVETSLFPSRKFTMACPNIGETDWMKDASISTSTSCKGQGECLNRGIRKVISEGIPPRYFPSACSELGGAWTSAFRDVWSVFDEKFFLNATDLDGSESLYTGNGTYAVFDRNDPEFVNDTLGQFISICQQTCIDLGTCAGVVLKREYFTTNTWCYLTQNTFLSSPKPEFFLVEPNAWFQGYQLQREYDFCYLNQPYSYYTNLFRDEECDENSVFYEPSWDWRQLFKSVNYAQREKMCFEGCASVLNDDGTQKYGFFTVADTSSVWIPSFTCACLDKCETSIFSPQSNTYVITYQPDRWCSLGSVAYGEIDMCADVPLEKLGEDATTDSALDDEDITMGNLGRRCLINAGTEEEPDWQKGVGSDCDDASARLDDTPTVASDYVPTADSLVFGAYSTDQFAASISDVPGTFGAMRPENPCNPNLDFFWNPEDRTQCKNTQMKESCDIHDWEMCTKSGGFATPRNDWNYPDPDIEYVPTLPCTVDDDVVAGVTYRFRQMSDCSGREVMMYSGQEDADGNIDNPGATYEEKVSECHKACVTRKTPHADTTYQWNTDKTLGFIVFPETGRCFCETQYSEGCTVSTSYHRYDFAKCQDLHSVHDSRAISPHRLSIGGEDLEAIVVRANFHFNIREAGVAALDAEKAKKVASRNSKTTTKTTKEQELATTRAQETGASLAYIAAKKKLSDLEALYPNCQKTSSTTPRYCWHRTCTFLWWGCTNTRYKCGYRTVWTQRCFEKTPVTNAKTDVSSKYKYWQGRIALIGELTKVITNLERQINIVNGEIDTLDDLIADAATKTCSVKGKCDLCQGNCLDDTQCRDGLICTTAINAAYSTVCGLTPATAANVEAGGDGTTKKYCMASSRGNGPIDNLFLVGFVTDNRVFGSAVVYADPQTYEVVFTWALSFNALEDDEKTPDMSTNFRKKRAETLLFDQPPVVIAGYIVNAGIAGSKPRPGRGTRLWTQRRGFVTAYDAASPHRACSELCATTAGCTISQYVSVHRVMNEQGDDDDNCDKYACGPCEGDSDGTATSKMGCMPGTTYTERADKAVSQDSYCADATTDPIHPSNDICVFRPGFYNGACTFDFFRSYKSHDYCVPDTVTKEDYKCMLYTTTVVPDDTYDSLGDKKYCTGGVYDLGHTSVREGKGPMDGSEALYYLLGDPDPVVECLNRCRYAKPTWRGFYTDSQIGCFCAPSCEEDDQVANPSTSWKAYRIVLKDADDVHCSDMKIPGEVGTVVFKKSNGCRLCKKMGVLYLPDNNNGVDDEQVFCQPPGDPDQKCSVFPEKNADDLYEWRTDRCAPVRAGFDKMRTSIVRVGEQFTAEMASPYITIKGHPDIEAYTQCESECVDDPKCQAWHFTDFLSPERGDDKVTHSCELYSYVPPRESTASYRENVFSGRTRIGTVQRDYSPITVFMDDGDQAACQCDEDADGGGYDCGCQAGLGVPYTPNVFSDDPWGCSGHGECGGLGYLCVCDDGWHWAWGAADAALGVPAGFTCRQCAAGNYKNSDVKRCTPCPVGTYQDGDGATVCKTCPYTKPTTRTVGKKSADACQVCPAGRVNSAMEVADFEDFINLNYDTSTGLCRLCEVGKFHAEMGSPLLLLPSTACGPFSNQDFIQSYESSELDLLAQQTTPGVSPNYEHCANKCKQDFPKTSAIRYRQSSLCHCYASIQRDGCDPSIGGDYAFQSTADTPIYEFREACEECRRGLTTSTPGKSVCDVSLYDGVCNNGKGWQEPDPNILGGSPCLLCEKGKWNDNNAGLTEEDELCKYCGVFAGLDVIGVKDRKACPCARGYERGPTSVIRGSIPKPDICVTMKDMTGPNPNLGRKGCDSARWSDGSWSLSYCTAGGTYGARMSQSFKDYYTTCCDWRDTAGCVDKDFLFGAFDPNITAVGNCEDAGLGYLLLETESQCRTALKNAYGDSFVPSHVALNEGSSNNAPAGCSVKISADGTPYQGLWNPNMDSPVLCGVWSTPTLSYGCVCADTTDDEGACSECPSGQFSASAAAGCENCPQHTYSNKLFAATSCTSCPAGYSFPGDQTINICSDWGGCTGPNINKKNVCGCGSGYLSAYPWFQWLHGFVKCFKHDPATNWEDWVYHPGCIDKLATTCTGCPVGEYNDEEGVACKTCPLYSYTNKLSAATSCTLCPAGYSTRATVIPGDDATTCSACPAGEYNDEEGAACKTCPPHTLYSDEVGQTACKLCPAGYSPGGGEHICTACPAGEYNDEEGAACKTCSENSYTNKLSAASSCKLCPVGYSPGGGENICPACPAGEYNDEEGATCTSCPAGYDSPGTGGTSCAVTCGAYEVSSWTQVGGDIDGEARWDKSGQSVSLSSDGSIVAIGAHTNRYKRGHVRVYEKVGDAWTQLGGDIDAEAAGDYSGHSVSLSADGSVVAIGAIYNDGIGDRAGHVRVYSYSDGAWTQMGGDIDGEAAGDYSGLSVSLSSDGSVVAIGAIYNDGIGDRAGHVRVYSLFGGTWTQMGGDIDGEAAYDYSGNSVSLSADGTTVAIGAYGNDGGGADAGHVRVYAYSGGTWTQVGGDIDGEAAGDYSGFSVSLSVAGSMVAIGAYNNDGGGADAGHVRVYRYSGGTWTQVGGDIDGEAAGDYSGRSVSLSSGGSVVAIGAFGNDGGGANAGRVRVYSYSSGAWTQVGGDFDGEAAANANGWSVSLSAYGSFVAMGAPLNSGNGEDAGHVRVYSLKCDESCPAGEYLEESGYEQIATGEHCYLYSRPPGPESSGFALFLDPSDPLASTDRAQECANRCSAEGRSHFFLHLGLGGRCMCGYDDCAVRRTEYPERASYSINSRCMSCLSGKYTDTPGQSACTACPAGYESVPDICDQAMTSVNGGTVSWTHCAGAMYSGGVLVSGGYCGGSTGSDAQKEFYRTCCEYINEPGDIDLKITSCVDKYRDKPRIQHLGQGSCSDADAGIWLAGSDMETVGYWLPRLAADHPLADPDPAQECANRCAAKYGVQMGAVYLRNTDNLCGKCTPACDTIKQDFDTYTSYDAYKIVHQPLGGMSECTEVCVENEYGVHEWSLFESAHHCDPDVEKITSVTKDTVELCQQQCDSESNCHYISYRVESGHCMTHETCDERVYSSYNIHLKPDVCHSCPLGYESTARSTSCIETGD